MTLAPGEHQGWCGLQHRQGLTPDSETVNISLIKDMLTPLDLVSKNVFHLTDKYI